MLDRDELWSIGQSLCTEFLNANQMIVPAFQRDPLLAGYGLYRPPTTVFVNVGRTRLPVLRPRYRSWSFPGWKTDRTAAGVTAHEVGHHVNYQLAIKGRFDSVRWRTVLAKEPPLTSYEPNAHEAFAEAMRLFVLNPDLLRQGRPRRFRFITEQLLLRPIVEVSYETVLDHPAYIEAAHKWIQKGERTVKPDKDDMTTEPTPEDAHAVEGEVDNATEKKTIKVELRPATSKTFMIYIDGERRYTGQPPFTKKAADKRIEELRKRYTITLVEPTTTNQSKETTMTRSQKAKKDKAPKGPKQNAYAAVVADKEMTDLFLSNVKNGAADAHWMFAGEKARCNPNVVFTKNGPARIGKLAYLLANKKADPAARYIVCEEGRCANPVHTHPAGEVKAAKTPASKKKSSKATKGTPKKSRAKAQPTA